MALRQLAGHHRNRSWQLVAGPSSPDAASPPDIYFITMIVIIISTIIIIIITIELSLCLELVLGPFSCRLNPPRIYGQQLLHLKKCESKVPLGSMVLRVRVWWLRFRVLLKCSAHCCSRLKV